MKPKGGVPAFKRRKAEDFPQRGSTYAAAATPREMPLDPEGQSGIRRTLLGMPITDANPEMQPYLARGIGDRIGVYDKMLRGEVIVASAVKLIRDEISNAPWIFEPPPEPRTQEEDDAVRLLNRVWGFDGTKGLVERGFREHISEAIKCIVYGFSLFEETWAACEYEGRLAHVITAANFREPRSIIGWLWDDETLLGALQRVPLSRSNGGDPVKNRTLLTLGHKVVLIPAAQLQHYGHDDSKGNPEGVAQLRAIWAPWATKNDVLITDQMIRDQYAQGRLWVREKEDSQNGGPAPGVSVEALDVVTDNVAAWAEGDEMMMLIPHGYDAGVDFPTSSAPSSLPLLEYLGQEIRTAFSLQFLGLGLAASKSLGDSFGQLFYNSLDALATKIAERMDGLPGVAYTGLNRKIIDANIVTGPAFRYPKLTPLGLKSPDRKKEADMTAKMLQFLGIRYSGSLEKHMRKVLKLPELSTQELELRERLATAKIEGEIKASESMGADPDVLAPEDSRASEEGTQGPVEPPEQVTTPSKEEDPA